MSDPNNAVSIELLQQLRDPSSSAMLELSPDGTSLGNGESSWKILNGIPRFVSDEHLKSFGDQWTTYEVAHDDEDRATFTAKTGMPLDDLKGVRVLDAGCVGWTVFENLRRSRRNGRWR